MELIGITENCKCNVYQCTGCFKLVEEDWMTKKKKNKKKEDITIEPTAKNKK